MRKQTVKFFVTVVVVFTVLSFAGAVSAQNNRMRMTPRQNPIAVDPNDPNVIYLKGTGKTNLRKGRTEAVNKNESITISGNRAETVGIRKNQNIEVENDETHLVGKNSSGRTNVLYIGGSERVRKTTNAVGAGIISSPEYFKRTRKH